MDTERYEIKELSEKDKDFKDYFDSDTWESVGFYIENSYEYCGDQSIKDMNNGNGCYFLEPHKVFLFRRKKCRTE